MALRIAISHCVTVKAGANSVAQRIKKTKENDYSGDDV